MLHHDCPGFLTLPPKPGYCLLVELQTPDHTEPHQRIAAALEIQSVTCRSRMYQSYLQSSCIPVLNALIRIQLSVLHTQGFQPVDDPCQIVLVPIRHQNALAVCRFDDILQSIQLLIVNELDTAGIGIDSTIRHLCQLPGKRRCIGSCNFTARKIDHQVAGHRLILLTLIRIQIYRIFRVDQFRHLQVVGSLHGNRDIGDSVINPLISTLPEPVAVYDRTVCLIRYKVLDSVLADKPSKSLSHIQNLVFCKEIHQTIAGRRAGQAHNPFHSRPYLHQCFEPLRLPVLKG